jgi:hypothetical protein
MTSGVEGDRCKILFNICVKKSNEEMLVDVAVERLEELEGERFEEPPILLRLETLMMICFDF